MLDSFFSKSDGLRLVALPFACADDVVVDHGATTSTKPDIFFSQQKGWLLSIIGRFGVNGDSLTDLELRSTRDATRPAPASPVSVREIPVPPFGFHARPEAGSPNE